MRVAVALIVLVAMHAALACPFASLSTDSPRETRKLLQRPGGGGGGGGGGRPGGGGGGRPGGAGGQPGGDRPGGNRPEGDRPGGAGSQPGGDRPGDNRPEGDRPGGNRPEGDRPGGDRPGGAGGPRPAPGGKRPDGDRPGGAGGPRPAPDGKRPGGGAGRPQPAPGPRPSGPPRPDGPRPRPRECNLTAPAIDFPTPSQTATDALVKQTVLDYLKTAMDRGIAGFVRAAWHDAGTYNARASANETSGYVGGANGSLLTDESLDMRAHRALVPTIRALRRFLADINDQLLGDGLQLSGADLIQLAGAYAVELSGGPSGLYDSIPVGRVDSLNPDSVRELPFQEPYNRIACKFNRNGYSVEEMVALTGAHTLGNIQRRNGPVPLDPTPSTFDVAYYEQLQEGDGVLASDRNIGRANPSLVDNYAGDRAAFFSDFAKAFVKMGKQGAVFVSYAT